MSNKIVLSILTLTTVVAGKFKESFAVVDQAGELIGSKAHPTKEEAEVELGTLKYFATGMEFARATAKEGTQDKALVGKANVVAAFLMYQERPEPAPVEVTEVTEEPVTEKVTVSEEF